MYNRTNWEFYYIVPVVVSSVTLSTPLFPSFVTETSVIVLSLFGSKNVKVDDVVRERVFDILFNIFFYV